MNEIIKLEPIAHIKTDFPEKFGVPRQSGLVEELIGQIIFEEKYRDRQAVRFLDEYSHIWLIWGFSNNSNASWTPTVRPPKLGGNKRVGVFATRSPFRPNPVGISSVRLLDVQYNKNFGPILVVSGIDMVDNTPIYDIKPYIPYTDSHRDALSGLSKNREDASITVRFPDELLSKIPEHLQTAVIKTLSQDPHPSYKHSSDRIYKMSFSGFDIGFTVDEKDISVCSVNKIN